MDKSINFSVVFVFLTFLLYLSYEKSHKHPNVNKIFGKLKECIVYKHKMFIIKLKIKRGERNNKNF